MDHISMTFHRLRHRPILIESKLRAPALRRLYRINSPQFRSFLLTHYHEVVPQELRAELNIARSSHTGIFHFVEVFDERLLHAENWVVP
jgi:hypothetical protein